MRAWDERALLEAQRQLVLLHRAPRPDLAHVLLAPETKLQVHNYVLLYELGISLIHHINLPIMSIIRNLLYRLFSHPLMD